MVMDASKSIRMAVTLSSLAFTKFSMPFHSIAQPNFSITRSCFICFMLPASCGAVRLGIDAADTGVSLSFACVP
jgi:hypothetical protein